jgi:hypothetical protein
MVLTSKYTKFTTRTIVGRTLDVITQVAKVNKFTRVDFHICLFFFTPRTSYNCTTHPPGTDQTNNRSTTPTTTIQNQLNAIFLRNNNNMYTPAQSHQTTTFHTLLGDHAKHTTSNGMVRRNSTSSTSTSASTSTSTSTNSSLPTTSSTPTSRCSSPAHAVPSSKTSLHLDLDAMIMRKIYAQSKAFVRLTPPVSNGKGMGIVQGKVQEK